MEPCSIPQKEGERNYLALECFLSKVCLLYPFVLQCRSQFEYCLFRKTFSCLRAIRNFETIDKEEFLGLH